MNISSFQKERNSRGGGQAGKLGLTFCVLREVFTVDSQYSKTAALVNPNLLVVGRGDNLQLFISPLLKYEGWLYNIRDDKNFEINSLEPPCTGGLKIPHTPMGTCRNAKNKNFEFCFDCGKNVFQRTKKNHLSHFDWNCFGSRYPVHYQNFHFSGFL